MEGMPFSYNKNFLWSCVEDKGKDDLHQGCIPTVARAMVVNVAQLATYSQAKEMIASSGLLQQGIILHFVASMISGFNTAFVSMPVDIAKTRSV